MSKHAYNNDDDVSLSDPDDYTTRERLKQIYEARRDLRDMRREASKVRNRGTHADRIRAVQHYRSGLESYLLELDTLLRQFEPGPELWAEAQYGTITIRPPGNWTEKHGLYVDEDIGGDYSTVKVESIPDTKEIPVIGLKWLFEAESPVMRDFEFDVHSTKVNETMVLTNSAYLSWQQLNSMVTDVNHFLGEIGIGLDADETNEWTL